MKELTQLNEKLDSHESFWNYITNIANALETVLSNIASSLKDIGILPDNLKLIIGSLITSIIGLCKLGIQLAQYFSHY
ncbi:hypothetical protein [Xenorhabdus sp. KK7.4]|uniref:hypothetical protein n=1 Tax=Xenorhabdus sp. KK7.4 TaxID=1851572 RepID=UPI000C049880|nr:hypothetical protein [Xenorhabdus sp. KK7.4]PHM51413.1 hypothetical protein Xekk_03721 [Xenorhabdus sp. KK7.4]